MAQLIVAVFVGLTNEVSHGQNQRVTWDCDIVTLKARVWVDMEDSFVSTSTASIFHHLVVCFVASRFSCQNKRGGFQKSVAVFR